MSDLFTQQSTMPELFKTGEDIAEELKAQTVEPNTATDLKKIVIANPTDFPDSVRKMKNRMRT